MRPKSAEGKAVTIFTVRLTARGILPAADVRQGQTNMWTDYPRLARGEATS